MTDKTFPLNYEIIEQLFENGVCLSYNPTEAMPAWHYAKQLERDFKKQNNVKRCRIISKTAKLWQRSYHPVFHYFSDGSLLFSRYLHEKGAAESLERVKIMLKIRGYKISKIYAPQEQIEVFAFDKMLRYISEQASIRYSYDDDLSVASFPHMEEFVAECFAKGNILLTAAKGENIYPSCRDYLALFADGHFFVSASYQNADIANFTKVTIFERAHEDYLRMELEYVPQEYIKALYAQAAKYDWFETPEDAIQKHSLKSKQIEQMQKYIDELFNARKCVSVLNPTGKTVFFTPDMDKYALFSDGLLLIAQSRTRFGEDSMFIKEMHKAYPNYTFKIEQIPDYYFAEIYRRLPEFQKSAATIYIEMLKQKARKFKRMLKITHHEALDMVAQMAGWQNWRAIKVEDETHARHLVFQETGRQRQYAQNHPQDFMLTEYKYWQSKQQHQK